MDDRLPMNWRQFFDALAQELPQTSPTPMSQGLQEFLRFLLTHRQQCAKLAEYGAELNFVMHVLYILVGFPTSHLQAAMRRGIPRQEDRQVLRQTWQAMPGLACLEHTIAHEGFAALSPELQTAIHAELATLRTLRDGLTAYMARILHTVGPSDPLAILLAETSPNGRGRGRPSAEVPTLFMVLLTDHLQERTGRRRYREIGLVASHLFAGSISPGVVQNPSALRIAVQDRCKKFRKTHDVAALRTALLATATPFLEHT
jgi:hypothetical protein